MIRVSWSVCVDTKAVRATRTLSQWVAVLALEVDRDVTTWHDVFEAVAFSYLIGGDFSDLIATPTTVEVGPVR
jgi:hypothetical protein